MLQCPMPGCRTAPICLLPGWQAQQMPRQWLKATSQWTLSLPSRRQTTLFASFCYVQAERSSFRNPCAHVSLWSLHWREIMKGKQRISRSCCLLAAQIIDPPPALLGTWTVQLQFNTSKAGSAFQCQLTSQGALSSCHVLQFWHAQLPHSTPKHVPPGLSSAASVIIQGL